VVTSLSKKINDLDLHRKIEDLQNQLTTTTKNQNLSISNCNTKVFDIIAKIEGINVKIKGFLLIEKLFRK